MEYTYTKVDAERVKRVGTIANGAPEAVGYTLTLEEIILDKLEAESNINREILSINQQLKALQDRRTALIAQKTAINAIV